MGIRSKVSEILDVSIREGRWMQYATILDAEGAFSKKRLQDILLSICEEVEELEKEISSLKSHQPGPIEISVKTEATTFHNAPKTSQDVKVDGSLTCGHCGKVCATEFGLKSHLRSHAITK